ncbi:hypothetical protein K443DRAFT_681319 [Laccaria amethystina LaAM-08-1]|uniref:DRBM domain-containing protein n=1 Tax=Laccaria amethystina LaAM-08-1 TaxID=1095629 RepID=A0A0C9WLZ7_9AGAR|nr:hypothetical protein K443DRAFT_681319 [Laccaria amethystina LaAM-08-1]
MSASNTNSFNNHHSTAIDSNNDYSSTDNRNIINHTTIHDTLVNRTTVNYAQGLEILRDLVVMSASFDSKERKAAAPCLPGTRQVLLDRIYEWGDSRDDRAVFWLHGPAGSGKTSIAMTVAEKYAKENRLVGNFFFSRDHPDCRSVDGVIATIAYQHATSHHVIKKRVKKVLRDPSIIEKLPKIQFEKLIIDPIRPRRLNIILANLGTFLFSPGPPMIVVIDALDECIINSVDNLIEIITHEYQDSPPPIRFLLTSRPEENIRATFRLHPERTCFTNLLDFAAYKDIRQYFKTEFKTLNIRLSDYLTNVKKPWPSPEDIESLVKKSEGLFIYASTLVMFVGEMGSKDPIPLTQKLDYKVPIPPAEKLKSAMMQHNGLDGLYLQVLQDATYSDNPDFMRILGALCLMQTQSSITNLAMFLRLKDSDHLRQLLTGCKSILRIPESNSETITFFHASLRDFLTNRDRSMHFYVDSIMQHLSLLDDCFQEFHIERKLYSFSIDGYPWGNWHNHLLALHHLCEQRQCGKLVDLLKGFFKDRYETVFLSGIHRFHDSNGQWPLAWGEIFATSFELNLEMLQRKLSLLEGVVKELPLQTGCLRKIVTEALNGIYKYSYPSMLNNNCQRDKRSIEYIESHEGPSHRKIWTLTVFVDRIEYGKGIGETKATAKAAAAKAALECLGWL